MPGQWWAVEELDPLDAFDPLLPVLSVDVDDAFDGGLYVALVELVVVDEELLEAASATAVPPNAPSVASVAKTATLRRIGMPPLRFMDEASQSPSGKPAHTPV